MPVHSTTKFTLAYLLPLSLAHLRQQKKHYLNMLSSKTNALLTHTLASFWRKQSCILWPVYGGADLWLHEVALADLTLGMKSISSYVTGRENTQSLCWAGIIQINGVCHPGGLGWDYYRKTSSISCNKSQNLNVSCIPLRLSSLNPLKQAVKLRMKM